MILNKLVHKPGILVFCSGLVLFLSSCGISTKITLNRDGSAHVYTYNDNPKTIRRDTSYKFKPDILPPDFFLISNQITELTWSDDSASREFNIKTIDSLGNHLYTGFNKNYFQFNYHQDTLIFTEGNGTALKDNINTIAAIFI